MKIICSIIFVLYSCLSLAGGGSPRACAFDAVLNSKLEMAGHDLYLLKITPVERVSFRHKGSEDSEWVCLSIGERYSDVVQLPKKTAQILSRQDIGATVRLVREIIGGEMTPDGQTHNFEKFILWDEGDYIVKQVTQ